MWQHLLQAFYIKIKMLKVTTNVSATDTNYNRKQYLSQRKIAFKLTVFASNEYQRYDICFIYFDFY